MIKMDVRELQHTGNWWTRLKWDIFKGLDVDIVLLKQDQTTDGQLSTMATFYVLVDSLDIHSYYYF